MCVCDMCAFAYICVRMCFREYTSEQMCIGILCACVYVRVFEPMCLCANVCICYVCVCVHVCVYMYVDVRVFMLVCICFLCF